MAAFDYIEARDTADELIAEFGQAVVVRRAETSGPAHDPTQEPPVDYAATAAVVGWQKNVTHFEGEQILSGDRRALIAAGGLAIEPLPTTDMLVLNEGAENEESLAMIRVRTISPAGTVVLYEALVRH